MSCPINELDQFSLNHWDTDTLCQEMHCRECIADPQDFYEPDENDKPKDYDTYNWEIPF